MPVINGKVAAIIDARHLVINRGADAGLLSGWTGEVILRTPDISDPDDPKRRFPGLRFVKAGIKVVTVFPESAYCEVLPQSPANSTGILQSLLIPQEKFPTLERPQLNSDAWIVRVGDLVGFRVAD